MLRQWIDRSLGLTQQDGKLPPAPPFDLPGFAERVKAAAQVCPTGRYGENKVFIVHVWRTLKDTTRRSKAATSRPSSSGWPRPTTPGCSTSAGPISSRRWTPRTSILSEVSYMNASFHFIRIDPGPDDHDARTSSTFLHEPSTP